MARLNMAKMNEDSGVRDSNAWLELSDPATVVENLGQVNESTARVQDESSLDFPIYEPGTMLQRQFSEPAKFPSEPATPDLGLPPGIRVKNTFLEYPVNTELDGMRWNARPVKIMVNPGQERHMVSKSKLGGSEGDVSTNGSDASNRAPSLSISVPDSPASKPTTPVDSPRQDLPLLNHPQAHASAAPAQQDEWDRESLTAHTVTIRGLPLECTNQIMTQELFDAGYKKSRDIDFLFVPRDVSTGYCLGCAFVNFKNQTAMRSFVAAFSGRTLRHVASDQALVVTISTFQDLLYVTGHRSASVSSSSLPMPSYCTGCGWQVGQATFNFCPRCGTSVRK